METKISKLRYKQKDKYHSENGGVLVTCDIDWASEYLIKILIEILQNLFWRPPAIFLFNSNLKC